LVCSPNAVTTALLTYFVLTLQGRMSRPSDINGLREGKGTGPANEFVDEQRNGSGLPKRPGWGGGWGVKTPGRRSGPPPSFSRRSGNVTPYCATAVFFADLSGGCCFLVTPDAGYGGGSG